MAAFGLRSFCTPLGLGLLSLVTNKHEMDHASMLVYLKICFPYIPTPYHKVLLRAKYQISVGLHYSQDDTDENDGYMTSSREESWIGLHSTPLILSSLPYLFYSYYIYTWGSYGVLRTPYSIDT